MRSLANRAIMQRGFGNGLHVMSKFIGVIIITVSLTSCHALSMSSGVKSTVDSTSIRKAVKSKSAVIIGGGPVGLAASLMLEKCGWNDITIIEKRSTSFFESTKAYLYLIDGRGQIMTDILGNTRHRIYSVLGLLSLLWQITTVDSQSSTLCETSLFFPHHSTLMMHSAHPEFYITFLNRSSAPISLVDIFDNFHLHLHP